MVTIKDSSTKDDIVSLYIHCTIGGLRKKVGVGG